MEDDELLYIGRFSQRQLLAVDVNINFCKILRMISITKSHFVVTLQAEKLQLFSKIPTSWIFFKDFFK